MMKKKYKYVIISPYFGKLPCYFNLWLESCSHNDSFRFIVFTDDETKFQLPKNVVINHISFSSFRKLIQSKFSFQISLDNPYKLCDYKPTYGYVFENYIDGCEYWGYCDIDLIFGDIEKFLPEDEFDKLSFQGHFCLYKNEKKINELFMNDISSSIGFAEILSNDQHFGFDEIGDYGINEIFKRNNYYIYDFRQSVADVDCRRKKLYCNRRKISEMVFPYKNNNNDNHEKLFIYDDGKVYSYDLRKKEIDKEYAYVHFQKRKMNYNVSGGIKKIIIAYNGFFDYCPTDYEKQLLSPTTIIDFTPVKFKVFAVRNRVRRLLTKKMIQMIRRKNQ